MLAACLLAAISWAHAESTGVETLGSARFTVITPQLVRMEYAPDGKFIDAPSWFAANRTARFTGYQVQRAADSLTIDTGVIHLTYKNDGKTFGADNLQAEIKSGDGTKTWHAYQNQTGNLGGANRTLDGQFRSTPITDGIISRDGWYLLDDSKSVLAMNGWYQARPKPETVDCYLFGYGLDYKAALKSLTTISGTIPLPRKYTMGIWYSRYWPYSQDDYRQIINEYHQHDFPLDVIVMDMDWHTDDWTGYTWNPKLIQDPIGLLKWFHEQGLAVTLNDHPAQGIQPKEAMYDDFTKAMGQDPSQKKTIPFDAGDKHYLDTDYKFAHAPLEKEGVDFWWLDWQQFPDTRSLPEITNLAMLNDYNFKETARDGKRGQSFSRWAGWGDQRYPIHFSGDANTNWPMLTFEVPFTSTSSNAGCFFWTHDIGGHMGGRNEESYTRWCQFGALSAALRSHSSRNAEMDRRPWTYPEWATNSMRISFHLRACLIPYLYSSAWSATQTSVPFLRQMYIDHPTEEAAYHNGQQYHLGDNLLVAPITMPGQGANRVGWQHVWFPGGTWYQYFSGEKYTGPCDILAAADINEFPVFVRGGVPLTEQPYSERPTTAPLTHLVLRCFPGTDGQTGTSTLYEDDGISDDYKKQVFATTELSYHRQGDVITVKIAPAHGSYHGQPSSRGYTLLLPATQKADLVKAEGATLSYDALSGTNRIELPDALITKEIVVTVHAPELDPAQVRQQAGIRRLDGLLGKSYAQWTDADRAAASPDLLNAVQATRGIGIEAVHQHPYFDSSDIRFLYYGPVSTQPVTGKLVYKGWSKPVTLAPGQPIDVSGLAEAVPRLDVITVPGTTNRLTLQLDGQDAPLSIPLLNIVSLLGDLATGAKFEVNSGRSDAINDGSLDVTNGDEWSTSGPLKLPSWAKLRWDSPVKATHVLLYDRANPDDQVLAGKLTFSDGSSMDVGPLPNDGKTPADISFPEKEITWVQFDITQTSRTTKAIGIGEIAVFDR